MKRVLLVLSAMFLGACGGGAATGGAKAPASEMPATSAEPAIDKKATEPTFEEAESAFAAAGNDCAQLCRALTSMTRATEHLCELAKENGDDKRCTEATTRLESARAKVKTTCGGCE